MLAFFSLEKGKGRPYCCLQLPDCEDTEKTEPDPSWRCTAMGQEMGQEAANTSWNSGNWIFFLVYYHQGALDKSLGAER